MKLSWWCASASWATIPQRFAHRYYDAVTVGIDFTAREMQKKLREAGQPWELAKGFDGSAAIGEWVDIQKFRDIQAIHFHLNINGENVQEGCSICSTRWMRLSRTSASTSR